MRRATATEDPRRCARFPGDPCLHAWHEPCFSRDYREVHMLTSKAVLLIGGWLALTAALVGTSGIAGDTASNALLVGGAAIALVLSRGPRADRR